MEASLSEPLFSRTLKLLGRPDGFMLYGKLGVDFVSTSELPNSNMEIRLELTLVRSKFQLNSHKPNVRLGIVDCSLHSLYCSQG